MKCDACRAEIDDEDLIVCATTAMEWADREALFGRMPKEVLAWFEEFKREMEAA